MSKFFVDSCRLNYKPQCESSRTVVICFKKDSSGRSVRSLEVAEEMDRPECRLNYSDMTIGTLLAAGIKPTALHINVDTRIGVDSDSFNQKVDELYNRIIQTEIPD